MPGTQYGSLHVCGSACAVGVSTATAGTVSIAAASSDAAAIAVGRTVQLSHTGVRFDTESGERS